MAGEIVVVCADEDPPRSWDASVFLAGAASAQPTEAPWPSPAIALLTERWSAGRLVVFVPGSRTAWEASLTDLVIVWAPCVPEAAWHDSQRMVLGIPPGMPGGRELAERAAVPVATSLSATIAAALDEIGEGARREGAEREVPLLVWRTSSFRRWYTAQRGAGNALLGARVVWTFRARPGTGAVFFWALHVRVHVAAEDRVKDNEVVISRPDVSVVALYRRGASRDATTVILVREFRSPASTPDGNVHELPGGSTLKPASPVAQAAEEVEEEIGLAVEVSRFRVHGSRQLAATMSAHHAHLFSAEITAAELDRLRAGAGRPHGVVRDSERTWVEIATYREIREANLVDWATLGMLAEALSDL
ncbi:hypothetical protein [Actinomadura sp. DC4]|uniref:hypothetical protein n=1 Tax=Actinomadura sp. DC4 TaxID=3055069 RepID=UPI0025B0FDA4|nr:hypothetical protein [Actinomadura sp. DC4]MDN3358226.1 hypothetical protein [Actinomadura sp. DC4]